MNLMRMVRCPMRPANFNLTAHTNLLSIPVVFHSIFIAEESTGDPVAVFIWSLVLVALLMGAFVLVSYIRRRLREDDEPSTNNGFLLDDLRALYQKGTITKEEFEKARMQLVEAVKRAADRKMEEEKTNQTKADGWDTDAMRKRRKKLSGDKELPDE